MRLRPSLPARLSDDEPGSPKLARKATSAMRIGRRTLGGMSDRPAFVVVLLHDLDPNHDRVIQLDRTRFDVPPSRIRIPSSFAGAAAWAIYELIAAEEWPEQAIYRHISLEPSTEPHAVVIGSPSPSP